MTIAPTGSAGARDLLDGGSTGRRWRLLAAPDVSGFTDAGPGLPETMRVLLAHRGVRGTAAARRFLGSPRLDAAPAGMPDLEIAVARLEEACARGERVAIFGDFDVDGVTASAVLIEGLRALGAHPVAYIPDRFLEGYGPNRAAVRRLAEEGATLLVTADCGTSAVDEVAEANARGMDVVILDHHTVPETLPAALAIVNPKRLDAAYGSEPAAVGVAFRIVEALHARMGRPHDRDEHLALVGLGTICDLAPLDDLNRDLVRVGLECLRRSRRPGLLALASAGGVDLASADAETCGWVLGPRLNAAGRMEHARLALDLLLAPDAAEAAALGDHLSSLNERRRDATTRGMEIALDALSEAEREGPLLVVGSTEIPMGVVGLVAARLAERCHRPAIVMQLVDGEGRASCRSIPGFDVTAMLRRHSELFVRFGGHRAAAGFTIDAGRFDEVRDALVADAAAHLPAGDRRATIDVDVELAPADLDRRLLQYLELLGPHGAGNPTPVFLARDVRLTATQRVGRDGAHLRCRVLDGTTEWRGIGFGLGAAPWSEGDRVDIVYRARRDRWGGADGFELELIDLRPAP